MNSSWEGAGLPLSQPEMPSPQLPWAVCRHRDSRAECGTDLGGASRGSLNEHCPRWATRSWRQIHCAKPPGQLRQLASGLSSPGSPRHPAREAGSASLWFSIFIHAPSAGPLGASCSSPGEFSMQPWLRTSALSSKELGFKQCFCPQTLFLLWKEVMVLLDTFPVI